MENIKYTTDGKKVVVIGNLNSQEKIVQEVFISNGQEFPSGENFVVKSLHDSPVISWKEKRIKDIEEDYKKLEKEYKTMVEQFSLKTRVVKEKLSFITNLETSFNKEGLKTLVNLLSGNIKFRVSTRYNDINISTFDDSIVCTDYGSFASLKLLTAYGNSKGDITYKMNHYSDGSGSWEDIHFFETEEEAIAFAKEVFYSKLENGLKEHLIKVSEKYGFEIPQDKLEEYNNKQKEIILEEIERQKARLEQSMARLEEFSPK